MRGLELTSMKTFLPHLSIAKQICHNNSIFSSKHIPDSWRNWRSIVKSDPRLKVHCKFFQVHLNIILLVTIIWLVTCLIFFLFFQAMTLQILMQIISIKQTTDINCIFTFSPKDFIPLRKEKMSEKSTASSAATWAMNVLCFEEDKFLFLKNYL